MDWTNKVPPFDTQYSATTHTDAQDCVEESLCHIIYMLTGKRYSPRALGYFTDVTPTGSNFDQAINAAEQHGLIPYDLWPTPDSFTWESYYAPIPQNVVDRADFYDIQLIPFSLDRSPGWTVILLNSGVRHAVAQINSTQYFDSELGGPIKNFGSLFVDYRTSIKLTPIKTMATQFRVNDHGKLGIMILEGFTGTILFADDMVHYSALCAAYGITPATPEISIP